MEPEPEPEDVNSKQDSAEMLLYFKSSESGGSSTGDASENDTDMDFDPTNPSPRHDLNQEVSCNSPSKEHYVDSNIYEYQQR